MERRRTDRPKQLEAILALYAFCLPTQLPITGIVSRPIRPAPQFRIQNRLNFNSTLVPLPCAKPVETIPLFGNRENIPELEILLAVISAAVNRVQGDVLGYLESAESKEPDVWRQQDYRLAQLILVLCDQRQPNPYSKAFFKLWGRNAHETRFWWRDGRKLLQLAQLANTPTPLLAANRISELDIIPDYDYSADHARALPPIPCNAPPIAGAAVRRMPAAAPQKVLADLPRPAAAGRKRD